MNLRAILLSVACVAAICLTGCKASQFRRGDMVKLKVDGRCGMVIGGLLDEKCVVRVAGEGRELVMHDFELEREAAK